MSSRHNTVHAKSHPISRWGDFSSSHHLFVLRRTVAVMQQNAVQFYSVLPLQRMIVKDKQFKGLEFAVMVGRGESGYCYI